MKRIAIRVACVAMLALALLGAHRAARAAGSIARTPDKVGKMWDGTPLQTPLGGVRVRRVGGGAGPADSLDLGTLSRAVVFVYDPECPTSNANMANWMELVREAPAGAPLYALTYRQAGLDRALAYWDGMHDRVPVLATDTARLVRRLGVPGTPTTLLVRDGVVRRTWPGVLPERSKAEVLKALREPPRLSRAD